MKTNGLLICILVLIAQNFYGQSLSELVKEAESVFLRTKKSLAFPNESVDKNSINFYHQISGDRNLKLLLIDLKNLESTQYKQDIGLVFKATANYNFRDAIEEATSNYIKGSVRAELEWNILKGGYFKNRLQSKILKNEIEALKIESANTQKELWRRQFRIDYNYILNKETIAFLQKFEAFENEYFDLLNKMYYQKLIKREKIITSSNQILVLKTQLETIKKENKILKDSVSEVFKDVEKLPIVKIRLDSILLAKELDKVPFKEENIRLLHHSINDINLSFYATQNYTYSSTTRRFFPSVGIRFRAPIRFNKRKKIIDAKIKILRAQQTDTSVGKYNASLTYMKEYNEKLKDLQNQYKSWQVLEERIRIVTILKSELDSSETGLLLLGLMEEQFKVLENTLQLKRQLYKVITRLFQLNEKIDFQHFFTPFNFQKITDQRIVSMLNSKKYSIDFQVAFLKAKRINNILVLSNEKGLQQKLKTAQIVFVKVDKIRGITTEQFIEEEINRIKK
ncbi:MAG: hypothetical protein JXR05_16210 [Flavobacteriaceae bacterium]